MQTPQRKRGIWLPNSSGNKYSSAYPDGNRPNGGAGGGGTLIARADWSLHGMVPTTLPAYPDVTWGHWDNGGATFQQIGDAVRGVYPSTIGSSANGGWVINLESQNIFEVYVQMDVRYPLPLPAKQGLKFLKFFGADGNGTTTLDSANFTFNPQYDSNGVWDWLAFGDGSTTGNDTSNVIFFTNINQTWVGRSFGLPSLNISRPMNSNFTFDDNWHTIKCIARYNSGTSSANEVADGRFYVEIDGNVYVDVTGFFNRHPQKPRHFKTIELFGWTQNTQAFTIDYRNVKISTGGFV